MGKASNWVILTLLSVSCRTSLCVPRIPYLRALSSVIPIPLSLLLLLILSVFVALVTSFIPFPPARKLFPRKHDALGPTVGAPGTFHCSLYSANSDRFGSRT